MKTSCLPVWIALLILPFLSIRLKAQIIDIPDKYFICLPQTVLYKQQKGDSAYRVRLSVGDSLSLIEYSYVPPGGTRRLNVNVWHGGNQLSGWVEGRSFGSGFYTDMDTNGTQETLVTARYLDYTHEELHLDVNKAEVILARKGVVLSRFAFKSFGHLRWLKYTPTGLPGLPEAWQMFNGYYMDYGSSLIYWNGRELNLLNTYRGYGSEGSSKEIDYTFPVSPEGKPGYLIVDEVENSAYSDSEGEFITTSDVKTHVWKWKRGRFVEEGK